VTAADLADVVWRGRHVPSLGTTASGDNSVRVPAGRFSTDRRTSKMTGIRSISQASKMVGEVRAGPVATYGRNADAFFCIDRKLYTRVASSRPPSLISRDGPLVTGSAIPTSERF
jgi:hypothetical protein